MNDQEEKRILDLSARSFQKVFKVMMERIGKVKNDLAFRVKNNKTFKKADHFLKTHPKRRK